MWQTVADFIRSHPHTEPGTQLYIEAMGSQVLIATISEIDTKFFQTLGKGPRMEIILRVHVQIHPQDKDVEASLGSLSTVFRLADRVEVHNVLSTHALSTWMEDVICGRP